MAQPFPGFLNSLNSARNAACLAYHAASREPVTSVWTGARLRRTSTWIFLWVGGIICCRSGCSILNRHHNCCYQLSYVCAFYSPKFSTANRAHPVMAGGCNFGSHYLLSRQKVGGLRDIVFEMTHLC